MKRIFSMILVVAIIAVFSVGCTDVPKDGLKEEADKIASLFFLHHTQENPTQFHKFATM